MSHEIDQSTGKAGVAYTGELPWHGLGQKLTPGAPIETWVEESGLNWSVFRTGLYTGKGRKISHKALIRKDTKKILSIVGPHYNPFQNRALFDWFKPLIDEGLCELHTAGSLFGGLKVWALAKLVKPACLVTETDKVEKYLMLSNAHHPGYAIKVGFTPIRVVCNNTLSAAHNMGGLLRVFHSSELVENLEKIRDTINIIDEQFEATIEVYRELNNCKIDKKGLRQYVKLVLDLDDIEKDELTSQAKTKIREVMNLAQTGIGNDGDSLWDAYNGVSEYLSYKIGRSQSRRLDKLWFGQNQTLLGRALKVAIEMGGIKTPAV